MSDTQAAYLAAFLGIILGELNIAVWKWYLKKVRERYSEQAPCDYQKLKENPGPPRK